MAAVVGPPKRSAMRRMARKVPLRWRVVLGSGIAFGTLLGCSDHSAETEWALDPGGPTVAAAADAVSTDSLSLVSAGTLGEGVLEDTRGALAASKSGRIAVYERTMCRVNVFDLRSRALLFRSGRCGAGPREFLQVSSLSFVGDTLFAWDVGTRRLTALNQDGEFVSRNEISALADGSIAPLMYAFASAPSMLIARIQTESPDDPMIAVMSRSGRVLERFLPDVPAARDTRRVNSLGAQICLADWPGGPTVIAGGTWRLETVALDTAGHVRWSAVTPVSYLREQVFQGRATPTVVVRAPMCSVDGVMMRVSRTSATAPARSPWLAGYVEVRSPSGRLLLHGELGDSASILFQHGVAWDSYWLFSDAESDVPRLRVFRLQPRTGNVGIVTAG
jgi:hypothetical protein